MAKKSKYCPHDDDPNCCPPCQLKKRKRKRTARNIGPIFPAQFMGECPECGREIHFSDELRMVDGVSWCRGCADLLELYG